MWDVHFDLVKVDLLAPDVALLSCEQYTLDKDGTLADLFRKYVNCCGTKLVTDILKINEE